MDDIINKLNNVQLIDQFNKEVKDIPPFLTIRPELVHVVADLLNTPGSYVTMKALINVSDYFKLLVLSLVKHFDSLVGVKFTLREDFSLFDKLLQLGIDVDIKYGAYTILDAMFNSNFSVIQPIKYLPLDQQLKIIEKFLSVGADSRNIKNRLLELLTPMPSGIVRDNILYLLDNPVRKSGSKPIAVVGKKRSRIEGGRSKRKRSQRKKKFKKSRK